MKGRILLVDDEEIVLRSCQRILRGEYDIDVAPGPGIEAVAQDIKPALGNALSWKYSPEIRRRVQRWWKLYLRYLSGGMCTSLIRHAY